MENKFTVNPMQQNDVTSLTNQEEDYDPYSDPKWWSCYGLFRRLKYGRFLHIFVDHSFVVVSDIDSIVNIFALVDALILTIPIAAITATKYSDWDYYKDLVYSCTEINYTYGAAYEYRMTYNLLANCAMCSVYCTLLCLVLTVIYYLSRPSEQKLKDSSDDNNKPKLLGMKKLNLYDEEGEALVNKNFRNWWKRGKYLLMSMFAATTAAVISLMYVVNMYYQIFFTASDDFCSHYQTNRIYKFSFGWMFVLLVTLISFYVSI